jgi:WD40 repeat protein
VRILVITGLVGFALVSLAHASEQTERRLPALRGQIVGVTFSPDGKYLATVTDGHSMNGELRVWIAATGDERPVKFDHPANLGFSAVAWSPDGEWLATAYWKLVKSQPAGYVALLHAPSGNLVNEWRAHDGAANSVAFSTNSKSIASGGTDGYVRLWDVKTTRELRAQRAGGGRVFAVAFSGNGKHLAAISTDGTLSVWDAGGKQLAFSANRHEQLAPATPGVPTSRALAFSTDGNRLATGDSAGNILIWDVATGRPGAPIRIANAEPIRGIAFQPNDHTLAVAAGPTVRIIDPDTGHESKRIVGYSESVFSLAFSPDGSQLAAGDRTQVHLRSMGFGTEPPSTARHLDAPRIEPATIDRPSTSGKSSLDLEPDRGPWVVAVGAGVLILLLGTIVMVCRRG